RSCWFFWFGLVDFNGDFALGMARRAEHQSLFCFRGHLWLDAARRGPERARIDAVRIEPQHLIVQLSRSGCRLGQAVEIADVLTGLFDDPGAVVVFGPLVSRDHRSRV